MERYMSSWMRTHHGAGLPFLVSVPHGGLWVPTEVRKHCRLTTEELTADGDVHAAEIYWPLLGQTRSFVATHVARAIVDLNRAADDRRKDGVVKTHTCWNEVVYEPGPSEETLTALVERYWKPYHDALETSFAPGVLLGIDCHTMAAEGPPVGPDPGATRPLVCLGNAHGASCSQQWLEGLATALECTFGEAPALNEPFAGGYITRSQGQSRPWIQIEMSRTDRMSAGEKRARLVAALQMFAATL